jgi:hypothetical protein
MTITNLTPHDVVVVSDDGAEDTIMYRRSEVVARAIEKHTRGHALTDNKSIGTTRVRYVGVEHLPDPQPDQEYIVSVLTVMAALNSGRTIDDLYYPGDLVRDLAGRVIGCRALYQLDVKELPR